MSIRLVLSMLVLLASAYAQAGPSSTEKGSIFSWTVADGKRLYDVLVAKGLPANQLDLAFGAFDHLGPKITNPRYMTIVNSSALMSETGFTLVNLQTGEIQQMPNSHGIASDVDGRAINFADNHDTVGSEKTSLGVYLTQGEEFAGKFGPSLRLKGYSPTNQNALKRAILVHGYDDVGAGYDRTSCLQHQKAKGLNHPEWCTEFGRLDEGCFGIPQALAHAVITKIEGGSLLFAYQE